MPSFLTSSGTVEGTKKYIGLYNMGSKLDTFLTKVFLFVFCSRRTAYIVRDNANTFASVGLSFKDVILFSEKVRVPYSLPKSNSITC